MKLLHFALIAPGSPQWGLRNALEKFAGGPDQYREFDWYPQWSGQTDFTALRSNFLDIARAWNPEIIFAQVQTPNLLPANLLEQIRSYGIWIMQWCGDLRNETPEWALKIAPNVDLNCFSNLRDVETIRSRGAAAEFLNIGFSTETFNPEGQKREGTPEVIFLGNNYPDRFPRSAQRARIVANLRNVYGSRFAVHGMGWGPNDSWLPEGEEAAAYRACKVALNVNHYDTVAKFTSDRLFRCMGSGAFCVSNYYPGIEEDFEIGRHLVVYRNEAEIPALIDQYLADDDARNAIADAGCKHVHSVHTWDSRIEQIRGFINKYRKAAA